MIIVHQRVAEVVVLVGQLEGRLVEHDAFLHAVALGKGAGGNVAHNDLERYDRDLFNHGLTVGQLLDKVGRHALLLEQLEHVVAHHVIDRALARNGALLLAVERGRVILVGDDDEVRIVGCEYLLGLAFVKLFFLFHVHFLHFYV